MGSVKVGVLFYFIFFFLHVKCVYKLKQRGKGEVRHVEFSYLNFTEVENPIIIDQHYCDIRGQCAKTVS